MVGNGLVVNDSVVPEPSIYIDKTDLILAKDKTATLTAVTNPEGIPAKNYQSGHIYILWIKGLKAEDGSLLDKNVKMKFTIK